ncbi:hypothetical protein [Flaviflagellibacter deserti]|jgi:hypothetical protein|uniref:Uncharacterized protein n=1 Tax=Flaviflagellibacter deserti TaxID=2267266 RepID=A0ABV9YZ30_9HYPH
MEANHVSVIAVGLLALCATIATAGDLYKDHGVRAKAEAKPIPASYLPVYSDRLPMDAARREFSEPGEPHGEY